VLLLDYCLLACEDKYAESATVIKVMIVMNDHYR
jgi:hypothetical protein